MHLMTPAAALQLGGPRRPPSQDVETIGLRETLLRHSLTGMVPEGDFAVLDDLPDHLASISLAQRLIEVTVSHLSLYQY